jgi:hypothetical protein
MRLIVIYLSAFFALLACVPVAKYHSSQRDLQNSQLKTVAYSHQLDSLTHSYRALKSDYNNLEYELSESEKYASFTDYELAKELDHDKLETEKLTLALQAAKSGALYTTWLSQKRANAFVEDAQCALGAYPSHTFVIQKLNSVYIDMEGLMMATKGDPASFKLLLVQLTEPLKNQPNWTLNICLNVADLSTDWHKITMQNEMMVYFATDAHLPSSQLSSITRIVPQEKSPEFGYFSNSRLLVEIEFKG